MNGSEQYISSMIREVAFELCVVTVRSRSETGIRELDC